MATNTPYYASMGSSLGGTVGQYLAQTSDPYNRYKNLYAPIGKYLGGMAGSLLSQKPLDSYLTSTLGNLGQIIGSGIGGPENRWAGPTGQITGTALSSLLSGKSPFSTVGTPSALSGYLGALGSGLGGQTGGIAGTIGGNILGNALQGYKAGTSAVDILSNLGSLSNIGNLGAGLLPYLLPKDMPPPAKSIVSAGAGLVLPALTGAVAPTLGGLGLGISGALGATPLAAATLPLTLAYNIYQDYAAQKKARKADEEWTSEYNTWLDQNWEKYTPLYDQIKEIGQQRLAKVGEMKAQSTGPVDPNTPLGGIYGQGYGVDPTTGLTQEEMIMLFGGDYAKSGLGENIFKPGVKVRSSYSQHHGEWPFERGLQYLMGTSNPNIPNLDYDKIIPWLTTGTSNIFGGTQQATETPRPMSFVREALDKYQREQAEFDRQLAYTYDTA